MAVTTEAEVFTYYQAPPGVWPPDDTEESVTGTDLHQASITNLRWGITEASALYRRERGPLPWKPLTQTMLLGLRRPDGSVYRTLPDVFVYSHGIDPTRPSMSVAVDGPPVLILEVLSASTYDSDLDIDRGKAYSYAQAGVQEYLALDPTATFVPEGGRGWRLHEGVYVPWSRDERGRWQSLEIPVAIGIEANLATVYTRDGRRLLREGEVEETLDRLIEENADLRRRLENQTDV
jgi:Uma2 family endonuclease